MASRAEDRDIRLLEQIRKLRRDRAEAAMNDARAAVDAAGARVDQERHLVRAQLDRHGAAQHEVSAALATGRQSLEGISKLLNKVDRARLAVDDAQGRVALLQRDQASAQIHAEDARRANQAAAVAHEKVLEWKRSV